MGVNIENGILLCSTKFTHISEPVISFARRKIWFNMCCLKRLPNTVHVHFLLIHQEKQFIVIAATDEAFHTARWCSPSRNPRKITCIPEMWQEITSLMGWNDKTHYKLIGKPVQESEWQGFMFDMSQATEPPKTWGEYLKKPTINRFTENTYITIGEGENECQIVT